MLRQTNLVLMGLALVLATAATASATTYTLTDLGTLGGSTSYAEAVNDYGVVAGASNNNGSSKIFGAIYTGGGWLNIGSGFSSAGGYANGINDNGLVSGWKPGASAATFVYNTNTSTYTNIGTQPGVCNGAARVLCGCNSYYTGIDSSYLNSINSSGEIVGEYLTSAGNLNGYIWNGSSTTNVPSPGTMSMTGINNSGVAVGNYQAGSNPIPTGFYYSGGTALTSITDMAYPEAINGNDVVGADQEAPGVIEAAVYTLGNSSATYLGFLPGDSFSVAYSASSSGTVVGAGTTDAFVYSNGVMTDLNTLVQGGLGPFSELNFAYGISPNGEYIVGDGTIASTGYTHGFLLTAVATPEPSTLLLAASGLMGLLAYAWRKRK
jgi:probable HAF family extracellular repeat protein